MVYNNFILAFGFNGWEMIVIAGLGLLIFGNRLPEVGKSLGRSIIEFKKGLAGIDDEIEKAGKKHPEETEKPLKEDDSELQKKG